MNQQGLSGINLSEPEDHDLQQSSLSGLFKTPPTHSTFIDGYWEREVAFIMSLGVVYVIQGVGRYVGGTAVFLGLYYQKY